MTDKLHFPIIHMNGNNGQVLLEEYQNAMKAAIDLRDAFSKIEFHPRDYYPLGVDQYDNAKAQRLEVMKMLNDIDGYLTGHAINIYQQINRE